MQFIDIFLQKWYFSTIIPPKFFRFADAINKIKQELFLGIFEKGLQILVFIALSKVVVGDTILHSSPEPQKENKEGPRHHPQNRVRRYVMWYKHNQFHSYRYHLLYLQDTFRISGKWSLSLFLRARKTHIQPTIACSKLTIKTLEQDEKRRRSRRSRRRSPLFQCFYC